MGNMLPENFNIEDALKMTAEVKEHISRYFHYKSLFFKALQKQICDKESENGIIYFPKDMSVSCSISGVGILFKEASISHFHIDQNFYKLKFEVHYVYNEQDNYDVVDEREYKIDVPLDLEMNFTQEKFDKWVEQKGEEDKTRKEKELRHELSRVKSRYPNDENIFKKLLKEFLKE